MKEFAILVFMFFCVQAMAFTTKTVECHYNNQNDTVVFTTVTDRVDIDTWAGKKKMKLHVKNINKPQEEDDYITWTKDSKSMTYSLNCKKL